MCTCCRQRRDRYPPARLAGCAWLAWPSVLPWQSQVQAACIHGKLVECALAPLLWVTMLVAILNMAGQANEQLLLLPGHLRFRGCRRTWTGAPWLDAVSDNPLDMNLVPSMKRKKGKKKEAAGGVGGVGGKTGTWGLGLGRLWLTRPTQTLWKHRLASIQDTNTLLPLVPPLKPLSLLRLPRPGPRGCAVGTAHAAHGCNLSVQLQLKCSDTTHHE